MMRFNVLIAVAVASALELPAAWNEGTPKINGPRVFGATPARDFTYAFPTTGSREALRFRVSSGALPPGAVLDAQRGVLSGRVAEPGEYGFSVTAENAFGKSVKPFTLVIRKDALALTPPMGWTSWNAFMSDIDQELIAATAKAIVEKGLAAHGYAFVNIDSCWQGRSNRKGSQALQPNELFPDMGGLVKDIHALGLKAGIYSTPMVLAWGMTQPWGCDDSRLLPGSTAHPLDPDYYHPHFGGCGKRGMEKYDAAQFAEWGFDWLKYDWSYTEPFHARRMREALDATGRDIILQVCTGCQVSNAVEYSECVQLARGMADTFDDWTKLRDWNMKHVDPWLRHVRPGFWCDMDMMSVGMMCIDRRDVRAARPGEKPDPRTKNHLTPEELQSHFAWWAIIPTPLFLSCDIINMDAATIDLVTNDDLIGINQDYPVRPAAYEDFEGGRRRIWTRQLSDGRIVLGLFNLGDDDWLIERRLPEGRTVRDVLSRTDLGVKDALSLELKPHACKVFLLGSENPSVDIDSLCPPRPETAAKYEGGSYLPAARDYRESAKMAYRYMTSLSAMTVLVETGRPDQKYQHNAYVSKTHAAHVKAMLDWMKLEPGQRDKAMRFARASAEFLLKELEPKDAPLAWWPPTYGRTPLEFDPRTDGPYKKPHMIGNEPEGAVKYRGEVMLLYPADVGKAFVDYHVETRDGRFLTAAVGIAETYLRIRRADGSWPLKMRLSTGAAIGENTLVPNRVLELFDALYAVTGDLKWRNAASDCFAWLEAHPLKDWNWDGQFEDIKPERPYRNPTKHNAVETMLYMLKRYPGDKARLAICRKILEFCEKRFVVWKTPANHPKWPVPSVLEQYSCFTPIDASSAKMIRAYMAMYQAEGRSEDLAKARALADTITRVQKSSGRIPTFWDGVATDEGLSCERYDWLNCMAAAAHALTLVPRELSAR